MTVRGYGAGGTHQYERLHTAIRLDCRAAFRSAALGIDRVMGRNAELVGFADVDSVVREMRTAFARGYSPTKGASPAPSTA